MAGEARPDRPRRNRQPTGVRHTFILHVDVGLADQTDPSAMQEIVEYWIRRTLHEDQTLTEEDWPEGWSVMHVGITLLEEGTNEEGKE